MRLPGPGGNPARGQPGRGGNPAAASSRSRARASLAICANGRPSGSPTHCSKATRMTVVPVRAARVAAVSSNPRARSAPVMAAARDAPLISSRSLSSRLEAMIRYRSPANSRTSSNRTAAASSAAPIMASAEADAGAASMAATIRCSSNSEPQNRTSRLSVKYRKNVRLVSPARSAISATVVSSYPRSPYSARAAACSRSRASGCHLPISSD
jgi:hypothetical protein